MRILCYRSVRGSMLEELFKHNAIFLPEIQLETAKKELYLLFIQVSSLNLYFDVCKISQLSQSL